MHAFALRKKGIGGGLSRGEANLAGCALLLKLLVCFRRMRREGNQESDAKFNFPAARRRQALAMGDPHDTCYVGFITPYLAAEMNKALVHNPARRKYIQSSKHAGGSTNAQQHNAPKDASRRKSILGNSTERDGAAAGDTLLLSSSSSVPSPSSSSSAAAASSDRKLSIERLYFHKKTNDFQDSRKRVVFSRRNDTGS